MHIVKPDELLEANKPTKPIALVPDAQPDKIAIITGSPEADLSPEDLTFLAELLQYLGITQVWHGNSAGVDACADAVARGMRLFVRPFSVDLDVDASERMVSAAWRHNRLGGVYYVAFNGVTEAQLEYATRLQCHIVDLRGRRA